MKKMHSCRRLFTGSFIFIFLDMPGGVRNVLVILPLMLSSLMGRSQGVHLYADLQKTSLTYAVKDTSALGLDVYTARRWEGSGEAGTGGARAVGRPCVLFVFGGAFIAGRRDDSLYNGYFNALVEHGYVVVSISYRLGLRGVRKLSPLHLAPLGKAVDMAVEDVYDATAWIIAHAGQLGVDTSRIVLSGSSSGAITVLRSDFDRCNGKEDAERLPKGFRYAGVIAFSGAVLSFDGGLSYGLPPAPTLLFHGSADKIVPYNKIRFFNKGFYGSSWIAKTFKKKGYAYYIYRAEGLGHEMAVLPMINRLPLILDFLDEYVMLHKPYQTDVSFNDPGQKPMMVLTAKELFKKLQQQ